jgi:hypothetical protein
MRIHRYYVIAIIAFGANSVWLAALSLGQQKDNPYLGWQHLTLMFLLGLLLTSMTRRLLGPGHRSAIAFFAPLLLLGPAITTLLGAAACLVEIGLSMLRGVFRGKHKQGEEGISVLNEKARSHALNGQTCQDEKILSHLFGVSLAAIAIFYSGKIYQALGGRVGLIRAAEDLAPAIIAGISLLLIEVALDEIAASLQHGRPLLAAWRNGLIYSLPMGGSVVGLGLLLALLYQQPHLLLPAGHDNRPLGVAFVLLVVLVPSWLLYYSCRLYLEMRRAYERTLRTLSGLVEVRIWGSPRIRGAKLEGCSNPGTRSRQVAEWAANIAEQMGLAPALVEQVRFAGYLLEVGKIGLSRALLARQGASAGSLTPRQRKAFARHAELGGQILEPVEFLRAVAQLIRHYQERYDGLGFPSGLQGEKIPLGSRILAVAQYFVDYFEGNEITSRLSAEEALARICVGRWVQFDPLVVDALAEVLLNQGFIERPAEPRVFPARAAHSCGSRL